MNINNQNHYDKSIEMFFHVKKRFENYKETIKKLRNKRDEEHIEINLMKKKF